MTMAFRFNDWHLSRMAISSFFALRPAGPASTANQYWRPSRSRQHGTREPAAADLPHGKTSEGWPQGGRESKVCASLRFPKSSCKILYVYSVGDSDREK